MPRLPVPVCAAVASALALGACGSGSDDDAPASTAYGDAVASVGSDLARPSFEWIDRARITELTGVEPEDAISDERVQTVIGTATGPLSTVFGQGADVIGFDPAAAPQSLVAGEPPDTATRFDGVDVDAVDAALREAGYEAGSQPDRLEYGDENSPIISGPLGDYGLLNVNRVALGEDSVTVAGSDESLDAISPDGGSLADDPAQQALEECVGDPVAVIQAIGSETTAGIGLEAIALAIPAFEDPSEPVAERICAVTPNADAAAELKDTAEEAFGPDGLDPVTRVPFEDLLGKVDVSSSESGDLGVVEIATSPPPETRVGFLFQMYAQGALTEALGGVSPLPTAPGG